MTSAHQLEKGKRKTKGLISRGMKPRRPYSGGQDLDGRNRFEGSRGEMGVPDTESEDEGNRLWSRVCPVRYAPVPGEQFPREKKSPVMSAKDLA